MGKMLVMKQEESKVKLGKVESGGTMGRKQSYVTSVLVTDGF